MILHSLTALSQADYLSSLKVVVGSLEQSGRVRDHIEELDRKGALPMELELLEDLAYLASGEEPNLPSLRKGLMAYSSPQSLWLVHNYHLGKNWGMTQVFNEIALEGWQRMIYLIHDYPESGRYPNLAVLRKNILGPLYPLTSNLRYAVINGRDSKIMKKLFPPGISYLLENPVLTSPPKDSDWEREDVQNLLASRKPSGGVYDEKGALWLYPVRGIRRKNVLEGGLLGALYPGSINLVVTLPGLSVQEKGYSDYCQRVYEEGLIQGFWSSGTLLEDTGLTYEGIIQACDLFVSPSVQEGFGYMYLNALAWQKPLLARKLGVMESFLPLLEDYPAGLYEGLFVPWVKEGKERFKEAYQNRITALREYLSPAMEAKLQGELKDLLAQEGVEFSYLPLEDQYEALKSLRDPPYKRNCQRLNSETLASLEKTLAKPMVDKSKELYQGYGAEAYSKAFFSIVSSFDSNTSLVQEALLEEALLEEFSSLEYLRLLYKA